MQRVLFICLGNVCRSPIAEAVFAQLTTQNGAAERYLIDSAGTNAYAAGSPPDPRMQQVARREGVPMSHSSRMFVRTDFDNFDLILSVDRVNVERAARLARSKEDRQKIRLLRDYDPDSPRGSEIPDPYYGGQRGFEKVYHMVDKACRGLFDKLEQSG